METKSTLREAWIAGDCIRCNCTIHYSLGPTVGDTYEGAVVSVTVICEKCLDEIVLDRVSIRSPSHTPVWIKIPPGRRRNRSKTEETGEAT
jgi:hypothetical protein